MRLLFFSPRCDRTGAEMVLYHLICNADRTTIKIAVACGATGELSKTFPRDVRVFNYSHALSFGNRVFSDDSLGLGLTNRAFNGIIRLIHERVRPDAWYVNSIVQPNVVALARELKIPCILHTHEQEQMFSALKPNDIENMISYPKVIIAASKCAAEVLQLLGRRKNIEICYGGIDISGIKTDPQKSMAIRQGLKILPDAFVWVMAGIRDPNKNPVGFVRVAGELLKQEHQTHFLWIGGTDTGYSLYAKALAKRLNIDDKISWVAERSEDYFDYLDVADGLVLTSLNESFSMVTLEAAALGKPFVSFDSGGPREIFRDGMGVIVDSCNEEDMVAAMLQVMRGDIYVNANISRARASELDISVTVKHWERIIRKYITE